MIPNLVRVTYPANILERLATVEGTRPIRVHMNSWEFQFEYEGRCFFPVLGIFGPTPDVGLDELIYLEPVWYPDNIDSFPGFDRATVIAKNSTVVAASVVRTLMWDEGQTTPLQLERVEAHTAYLIDVGFTVAIAGRELAFFTTGTGCSRAVEFVDDTNRASLLERYQFLTLAEARSDLRNAA